MIKAINYTKFKPSLHMPSPKTEEDIYLLFKKDELLVKTQEEHSEIPIYKDVEKLNMTNIQYLGLFNGHNCFCGELSEAEVITDNMYFITLRSLMGTIEEDFFWLAATAIQIVNWNKNYKYCGRCGSVTEIMKNERARQCLKCGLINYPRISPAIIVAVVKEDKLLLAHNNQWPKERYSVIAGFVEAGETLEQCVAREVSEEIGIKIKNIKYFGSQPWPFPNSLMVGFTAEYAEGEINVDGIEIGDANWYKADELPVIPTGLSISRKLIEWFSNNY